MLASLVLLATPATAETGTYLRFAQLAVDMPGTELVVSSVADPERSLTLDGGQPGEVSDYARVEPGDYVLAVRPTGSPDAVLVQAALRADPRTSYTVLAGLPGTDPTLRTVTDDLVPAAAGAARVRVIDARTGGGPLELADAAGVTTQVPAEADPVGGYLAAAAGPFTVGPVGGSPPAPVELAPGSVVTVFVLPDGAGLRPVAVVDALGPQAAPPGPVHAGYGGLAGSASPVTPVALLVVGLGALVVWVRSGRRPVTAGRG